MRTPLWLTCATIALGIASGCNKGDGKSTDPKTQSVSSPDAPQNIRQLKELKTKDIKVGSGKPVQVGDQVFMIYTGKLKSGLQFDSNDRPDGSPYGFVIGNREVIQGWDLGIVGMRVGGIRKIEVPNKFAYGDNPQGEKVPPGADLYFDVEVVDVVKKGEEDLFDKTDKKIGGGKICKIGDLVETNYVMKLANGRIVDSFQDKLKPVVFRIGPRIADGDREVPRGIYAAMLGMKEGGIRSMRIPPKIGFSFSSNPKLPSNNVVYVDMELIRIR